MKNPQTVDSSITVRVEREGGGHRAFGHTTPVRRLPNLLFEVAVEGTWQIEDAGDLHLVAPRGQGFAVPSEYAHKLTYIDPAASRTRYWMISVRDALGRDLVRNIGRPWVLSQNETTRLVDCLARCSAVPSTIAGMLENQRNLLEIGGILFARERSQISLPPAVDPRMELVMRYIDEHLAEDLSRDVLADLIQLSPTRFHYVFVAATGVSPTQHVIDRRLAVARQLLVGTSRSVKEIARLVGYGDALQF
ncbi:MAG TPA: AraC family transcriptional regulator, partial [Roseimicrobium sp.]|nr:AraC family transcriptional regulator [Roseimicrobium sp.]